mgnify:CR=1 FL=1
MFELIYGIIWAALFFACLTAHGDPLVKLGVFLLMVVLWVLPELGGRNRKSRETVGGD